MRSIVREGLFVSQVFSVAMKDDYLILDEAPLHRSRPLHRKKCGNDECHLASLFHREELNFRDGVT